MMARKLTYDEVKYFIEVESGSGCKLISEEYKNAKDHLLFECSCGRQFKRGFDSFKNKKTYLCDKCLGCHTLSFEEVKEFIENTGCTLISKIDDYKNPKSRLIIKCWECEQLFNSSFYNFKNNKKTQCNKCAHKNAGIKERLKIEDIREYVESKNCKLLSEEYIANNSDLKFQCSCGNEFECTYANFKYSYKTQCNECGSKLRNKDKRITFDQVKNFIRIESDCILLSEEYIDINSKMKFQCICGNCFETDFATFKYANKRQCNDCGKEIRRKARIFDYSYVKNYIENENGYKLLSEEYLSCKDNLEIMCDKGHIYSANFGGFKQGYRCSVCGGSIKYTLDQVKDYIKQNGYNLLSEEYLGCKEKMKVECNNGHIYPVNFDNFKQGKRCPICGETKGETKVRKYLEDNNILFNPQHIFPDLKRYDYLKFDFAIFNNVEKTDLKCLIEYDGEFHYFPLLGEEILLDQQFRDRMKDEYCKKHNIILIRIPYWDFDKIEEILDNYFNNNIINKVI